MDEIREHLGSGNFGALIGVFEDATFECKKSPYQLEKNLEKQELAKDISALANAQGGALVVGLETTKHPTHQRDMVILAKPFDRALVNTEQYLAILKSWIYPQVDGLTIAWQPSAVDSTSGVVIIKIPPQDKANWPFLVIRHQESTSKRSEIVFGHFQRNQSSVDHFSVHQLHSLLRDGYRHASLSEDLARIEQKLDLVGSLGRQAREEPPAVDWGRILTNRLAQAREASGLDDRPTFALMAYPTWRSLPQAGSLFERRRTDIVSLLKAPPEVRDRGFDLHTHNAPRRTSNGGWLSVKSVRTDEKALAFWDDLFLLFVANGDEYLCRGNDLMRLQHPLLINPLVLIESVYLFVLLAEKLAHISAEKPVALNYNLMLRDMKLEQEHAKLPPGPFGRYESPSIARLDDVHLHVSVPAPLSELPARTAFRLVADLYDRFGLKEEDVPYVETIDNELVISAKEIRAVD